MIKKISFLFTFIIFLNCGGEELVPAWDAQTQINAAAQFRADKCNEDCVKNNGGTACTRALPSPPLFVFKDQFQRNLNLCSIAITRTSCPFTSYPLACLLIYDKEIAPDLPWFINFNEFAKQKFR